MVGSFRRIFDYYIIGRKGYPKFGTILTLQNFRAKGREELRKIFIVELAGFYDLDSLMSVDI